LALDQKKTVTPNKTPENAITSNRWIKWSTAFPRITIDDSGRVKGMVEGVTGLTFTDKITRKTGSCIVNVTCLPNGTYFLKNKETSNYAKVKNATMADNQNVVQYDFEGSASQRWIFTLNSSTGYYSIRSANSAYHYMTVQNDSTFNDMPIVIMGATESTLTDGMKWRVTKLPDGAYKITPKTGEANDYVLATSTSLGINNAGLVQGDYIDNNSYCDEWIFEMRSDTLLEGQRWSNWCWVASARMLSNHYYSVPNDRTQNNAVLAVMGEVIDNGGTHDDAIKAAGYYISNDINSNIFNLVGEFQSIFSENTLIQLLKAGHVVYIARGNYDINNNRRGGHALLIVGYTMVSVDGTLQYRYVINDPWPVSSPNPWTSPQITTGQVMVRSYQWICNGQNALSSNHIDNGIWDRYVVVQTDYSINTFSPVYN